MTSKEKDKIIEENKCILCNHFFKRKGSKSGFCSNCYQKITNHYKHCNYYQLYKLIKKALQSQKENETEFIRLLKLRLDFLSNEKDKLFLSLEIDKLARSSLIGVKQ